ncbi:Zn-dependent hydrolase, partial [Pseudomonas syringae]|nr:Zn-dependent hydrolase [Pseudomonas syringae]
MSTPPIPDFIDPSATDLSPFEPLFRQRWPIVPTPPGGMHRLAACVSCGK